MIIRKFLEPLLIQKMIESMSQYFFLIINDMEIRHYTILGKVQGVGYRYFTKEIANLSGIKGWVRNHPDGSVECLAAGQTSDLEMFEKKIRKGPPLSRVVNMDRKILRPGETDIPDKFDIIQ